MSNRDQEPVDVQWTHLHSSEVDRLDVYTLGTVEGVGSTVVGLNELTGKAVLQHPMSK